MLDVTVFLTREMLFHFDQVMLTNHGNEYIFKLGPDRRIQEDIKLVDTFRR